MNWKLLLMLSSPGQHQMCRCPYGNWPTKTQVFKIEYLGMYQMCLSSCGTFLLLHRIRNAPTLHLMKTDPMLFEGLMSRTNLAQKAEMT